MYFGEFHPFPGTWVNKASERAEAATTPRPYFALRGANRQKGHER